MDAHVKYSTGTNESEISAEMIYRLFVPKKVWKKIKFDENGNILQTKEIKEWLKDKEKEVKQRLKKKSLKECSVNCFVGRYGEDEELGLKVVIRSASEKHEDLEKILLEEKDCGERIISFANKIKSREGSHKKAHVAKGGKITIIH